MNDMESLRKASLQDQINYYGYSYGTYLGQIYSTLYPNRIQRMVLDSSVDPRNVWFELMRKQSLDLDRNMGIWFRWLAKYDSIYHLRKTEHNVAKRWHQIMKRLEKEPANGTIGLGNLVD